MTPGAATLDLEAVQRRTLRILTVAQVLGGLGVGAAISVGGLIAEDVSGSTSLSGLAQTATVLGAAVAALPMARYMSTAGRRPGLVGGYAGAIAGAILVIAGTVYGSFTLVLIGAFLQGCGTATNMQSRYAAADLAKPEHRGRALSTIVWATTVGVVLGPNLTGPGAEVAGWVDLPKLAGPVLFSVVAYVFAAAVLHLGLRPDPLLTAHAVSAGGPPARASMRTAMQAIGASPAATLALVAIATAHTVMVSVMVMTPVHMRHHDATLTLVGIVISAHVAGMYAFSPLVGWLTDRIGRVRVLMLGQVLLAGAVAVAGLSGTHGVLGVGLTLLGLGWSFCLIAGSTLLSESVDAGVRPGVQGASDFVMGMCGAVGGALAGVVMGAAGFGWLNLLAGVLIVPAVALGIRRRVGPRVEHTFG
jgi:MFS family permease